MNQAPKDYFKVLQEFGHQFRLYEKFEQILEITFCSLASRTAPNQEKKKALFDRIQAILNKYPEDHGPIFRAMQKCTIIMKHALEQNYQDFMGPLFMEADFGNKYLGQFFTSDDVSKLVSMLQMSAQKDEITQKLKTQPFITVHEPTLGSGGMVIQFAGQFEAMGFDPKSQLLINAIDRDHLCVKMAFIQLSLLGIPALISHGDTLKLEIQDFYYTEPAIKLGLNPDVNHLFTGKKSDDQ